MTSRIIPSIHRNPNTAKIESKKGVQQASSSALPLIHQQKQFALVGAKDYLRVDAAKKKPTVSLPIVVTKDDLENSPETHRRQVQEVKNAMTALIRENVGDNQK